MRKILTQGEKDKKVRRNQLIIGLILIGVMIFGTLGYAFSGKEDVGNINKTDYKGIEFVKEDDYWRFNIQNYNFITKYNPQETEDILFFSSLNINSYVGKPLYFVSKFNEPNFEISRNLNQFASRINEACLDENCEKNFPIKNCSIDNIITIKEPEDEFKEIRQEDNCIFITSDLENQTRYADAFLFKILGI